MQGGQLSEYWKIFYVNGQKHFRKYVDNVPTGDCKNYGEGTYPC